MRSHMIHAVRVLVTGLVALGCVQGDGTWNGTDLDPDNRTRIPPAPADCRPAQGERAYWFDLRVGPTADGAGPRMAELVVRHPEGVVPVVTGLEAARAAQKELHVRPRGEEMTRVVLLSSNNLTPLPAGPIACLKVPADAELSFVRGHSEFAPAMVEPDSDVIELWPVEESQ